MAPNVLFLILQLDRLQVEHFVLHLNNMPAIGEQRALFYLPATLLQWVAKFLLEKIK